MGIQGWEAKYFLEEGGELVMEVNPHLLTFTFKNGATSFSGKFGEIW